MTCAIKAKLKDLQRMGKADGHHSVPRQTGFLISFPRRTLRVCSAKIKELASKTGIRPVINCAIVAQRPHSHG